MTKPNLFWYFTIFLKLISGTPQQMQEDLNHLFEQSATMRMFASAIANTISDLDGYGCWCYLFSHGKGKSQPVDEIDSHCKTLQQAYQCIMMEVEEESNGDDSCIPWEEQYVSGVSNLTDFGVDIVQHCEDVNDGASNCAKRVCAVETGLKIIKFYT